MSGAHCVESELLHHHEISANLRGCDHSPGVFVEVVAVDAVDEYWCSVHQQFFATNFDAPKPNVQRAHFDFGAVGVDERHNQSVQVRLFV